MKNSHKNKNWLVAAVAASLVGCAAAPAPSRQQDVATASSSRISTTPQRNVTDFTDGLRCMDGPYAAYQDASGLDRMSLIARAMGFDGKQCIHPGQLATVNAVFQTMPPSSASW